MKTREGAIAKGVPITSESVRLTFDEAVKDVAADYTVNGKRSKPELDRRLKLHLAPYFGGRRLSAITTADNYGRVPSFEMLTEDNVRTGFFDDTMIKTVIEHLPPALRAVVRFAYISGWRVQSEILPLEWRQVDRKAHTVRLNPGTTKNKKGRSLDFGDHRELRTLFEEQWAQHEALPNKGLGSPWVFHRSGRRIKGFRKAWTAACVAGGHPGRLPHDLRRSAARNLVRSGVPDTVAMKITRHRTRSVFDRYDITSEADVREGLGRLEHATGTISGDRSSHASADAKPQSA